MVTGVTDAWGPNCWSKSPALLLRLVVGDLHLENYCSFQLPVMIARHGSSRSAQVVRRKHSVKGGEDSSDSSEVDQITLEVTFAETFSNTRVLPFLLMLDVHVLPMAVAVEDTSVRELLRKLLPIAKGFLSNGQRERMPVQGPTAVQSRSNNVCFAPFQRRAFFICRPASSAC